MERGPIRPMVAVIFAEFAQEGFSNSGIPAYFRSAGHRILDIALWIKDSTSDPGP